MDIGKTFCQCSRTIFVLPNDLLNTIFWTKYFVTNETQISNFVIVYGNTYEAIISKEVSCQFKARI